MWGGVSRRLTNRRKFFRSELEQIISLDSLYEEAYILVKHANFSLADVKNMTRSERLMFLRLMSEEAERTKDAIKWN